MLMVLAQGGGTQDPTFWAAIPVPGVGRALTRQQAELVAAQTSHPQRFLLAFTDQSEQFGPSEGGAPTLAILPGETVWQYGEPTYVDSFAVLKAVMDGAVSPDPDSVLLPVADVYRAAVERFGEADPHEVEAHFDRVVLDLGGYRTSDPPGYCVSISRLLGIA
jgi:hypothetical protein